MSLLLSVLLTCLFLAWGGFAAPLPPGTLLNGIQVTGGTVEISPEQYKADGQSLLWTWQGGSRLTIVDEDLLWGLAGFTCWIYNEEPLEATLVFKAGPVRELERDNPAYAFEVNLNFSGWRWIGVDFSRDARVEDYSGSRRCENLEIHAPPTGSGRLYLDLVEFPRQLPWWLPADRQIPFVNPGEVGWDKAGQLLYYDLLTRPPISLPADYEVKLQDLARIEERYRDWVLGYSVDWSDPLVTRRYQSFISEVLAAQKRIEDYKVIKDGRLVLGKPLLPDQNGRLTPFEDLFKDLSTLATAYHLPGPKSFGNPFYKNRQLLRTILDLFHYLNEQGWSAGSSFGANNRFIRTCMGGYANAVFLMKEELKEAGLWEQQLETLRWYGGFGEVYITDGPSGAVTGDIRSNFLNRLLYVLGLEDGPEKVLEMQCLTRYISRALEIAEGWDSFIKPDYTGYTHAGAIGNTYTTSALHTAAATLYLLHDTSFAPANAQNVWRALLQARIYSQVYDIPSGLACRWPFMVDSLYEVLPAFGYGALLEPELMAGAFMRLWDPANPQIVKVMEQAGVDYSYLNTLGAVGVLLAAAHLDVPPEPTPTGHWHLPYGALSIHRRDDWLVSVKGWSRYVWNFECQPASLGVAQNIYGRYMSHGAIQIYGTGSPVNAKDSGYVEQGWDWNRWPGTTAIYLPWDLLVETKSSYGRHFTTESFVGGVVLGDNGIWAMRLRDTVYEPGFVALKTVFFFDDKILCLGSGITNNNTQFPTETTVYQVASNGGPSLYRDAEGQWQPLEDSLTVAGGPLWLLDPVGNGYYIPEAKGLRLVRQEQSTPLNTGNGYGHNLFDVAWFDHGTAPQDQGYEYVIMPQVEPERLVQPWDYTVVRKDAQAHIVSIEDLTGYVLFEVVDDLEGLLQGVDTPCILLMERDGDKLHIAVADPDLGWETRNATRWTVRLTLRGNWVVLEDGENVVQMVDVNSGTTTVTVAVTGGFTQQFTLREK